MAARANGPPRVERPAARVAVLLLLLALAGTPGRALAGAPEAGEGEGQASSAWAERSSSLRFADAFLGFPKSPLRDDNGFVANLRVTEDVPERERGLLRLVASEQLITERGGLRRVDEGRVTATWLRFAGPTPLDGRTLGATLGVDVVGNLGGSVLQDWAHRTLFEGRLLSGRGVQELQDRDPRGYDVMLLVGAQASASYALGGPWFVAGGADAAVALGTAFFGELHPFAAIGARADFAEVEFRAGAGIYGTNVRALTIPGGYVTRALESQPSVRVKLRGPPWLPSVALDLEWNRGDSHQHVGGITLGARY